MKKYDYLIVGSGLYGSVFAQQLKEAQKSVLVIERRNHIGGNCFSYTYEDTNILIHKYGTHLFHTDNKAIWDYINQFSEFNRYQHRVLTKHGGRVYSMPINLGTINSFYGLELSPGQVEAFLNERRSVNSSTKNFEEKAISLIGIDLYEAFIKGYTLKQWQRDPKELPASIINRLPVRNSYFDSYFDDLYQGVPVDGYTPIFERMLKDVPVELNVDFFSDRAHWESIADKIVYTGPIDRYFDYCHGRLNWRSVRFEVERLAIDDFQGTAVMNYADVDVPYTRIHEPKHLHRERTIKKDVTVIMREFSHVDQEEPYYPVNTDKDRKKMDQYKALCNKETNILFGGRLAMYRYFDMHHVIALALSHSKMELSGHKPLSL